MKCILKIMGQIQVAEVPLCLSCNQGSLTYLLRRKLSLRPYTFLPSQSHYLHPSQESCEKRTEKTFDLRRATITGPVVRGLYIPTTQNLIQKALHEIMAL